MTKIIAARSHHKHLRGIDRSSAIVAPWAMALNPGPDQYTGPAFSAKACFMVAGDITNTVNKGNWAGPMSSLLIWMSMANTKCKTYNLLSNESKIIWIINWQKKNLFYGCGSVGRGVASDTRGPLFESSHRWIFIKEHLFNVNCIENMKIKKKRPGMVHLKKSLNFRRIRC